jgi:Uma2 family endonuclease
VRLAGDTPPATRPDPRAGNIRRSRALSGGTRRAVSAAVAAVDHGAILTAMSTLRASSLRHVRPVSPLHFPEQEPESERMGQGKRHHRLCEALYQMLEQVTRGEHTLGADQFVYFNAADPRRCLAPDAFVKLGVPDHLFETWRVWERGAPELAFEVLSPRDTPERWKLDEKLRRYRELGVRELVVANLDAKRGRRLRVWDRLDDDLVERVVEDDRALCLTLGVWLRIAAVGPHPVGLRLARDPEGSDLVLTAEEARAAADEARRKAELRVEELEARLKARSTAKRRRSTR